MLSLPPSVRIFLCAEPADMRLEKGTYRFPTSASGSVVTIRAADLAMLLDGVDLASVRRQQRYRRPTSTITSE